MREGFTTPSNTVRRHTTAQVRGAAERWVVWWREVACSTVSGKSLARTTAWWSKAPSAGAIVPAALDPSNWHRWGALLWPGSRPSGPAWCRAPAAYTQELQLVDGLWSGLKAVELAHLTGPTPAEVIASSMSAVWTDRPIDVEYAFSVES
jgi:hypothetical protein